MEKKVKVKEIDKKKKYVAGISKAERASTGDGSSQT